MLPEPTVGWAKRRRLGKLSGHLPHRERDRHQGNSCRVGEKRVGPGNRAKRRRREQDSAAGQVVERFAVL